MKGAVYMTSQCNTAPKTVTCHHRKSSEPTMMNRRTEWLREQAFRQGYIFSAASTLESNCTVTHTPTRKNTGPSLSTFDDLLPSIQIRHHTHSQ